VIITASGFVIGWGIDTNLLHAVGGFALLVLFAFSMVCLGTLIGIIVRSPDAVMGIAFMFVFPLTFLSNAFVPAGGLPSALQTFAEWNPFSAVAAGVRTLFGNPTATTADPAWPLQHPVLSAFLWCFVLLAVVGPLIVNRFQARTVG
jgi:ABC-2 type transport system permease protein